MAAQRSLPWDWYPGTIPDNVVIDETAYVETTYSFYRYRSKAAVGVRIGRGASTYLGTMFDVGPHGTVAVGQYALVHGAWIICDAEITIGDYSMISWNVVLMDSRRLPRERSARRQELEQVAQRNPRLLQGQESGSPIHIDSNVWIGFDACILPGVTIGEGAVVGARSVVMQDVAPYTIVAGNPARVIRALTTEEINRG